MDVCGGGDWRAIRWKAGTTAGRWACRALIGTDGSGMLHPFDTSFHALDAHVDAHVAEPENSRVR